MFVKTLLGASVVPLAGLMREPFPFGKVSIYFASGSPSLLRQLENVSVFCRACHAFGDGSIPHNTISIVKVEGIVE